MKYSQYSIDRVKDLTTYEVANRFLNLKKAGAGYTATCPWCDGEKKLSISPAKDLYKCFSCDKGGKGGIDFFMQWKGVEFIPAVEALADEFKIILEKEEHQTSNMKPQTKKKTSNSKLQTSNQTFRDEQLKSSGIDQADQRTEIILDDNTKAIIDRYTSGSIDKVTWQPKDGDDMICHYVTLDRKRATYYPEKKTKPQTLYRVRWQYPEQHLDKDDKPIKYQSPYKSGVHLWYPNAVLNKYRLGTELKTLHIQEGEKKADAATMAGLISVGVMGIHNIAQNKVLCEDFIKIIKRCKVETVCFWFDSDYNDLHPDPEKPADGRARSNFLSALKNFHDYFYNLNHSGINLQILFAHGNSTDYKGIDDLSCSIMAINSNSRDLYNDFHAAAGQKEGTGKYCTVRNITGWNEYKLKELFHLQSIESFVKFHLDELKQRGRFKWGNYWHKLKLDNAGNFEEAVLDEALEPDEKFFNEYTDHKTKQKRITFNYRGVTKFLANRAYNRFKIREGSDILIKTDGYIVKPVEIIEIRDYVLDFTENAIKHEEVSELLHRGHRMYLSHDTFSLLPHRQIPFYRPELKSQILIFANKIWIINEDGIIEKDFENLDKFIWRKQIVQHRVNLVKDFIKINRTSDNSVSSADLNFLFEESAEAEQCDFYRFIINTCNFFKRGKQLSEEEGATVIKHVMSKLTAIGYMLHNFRNENCQKLLFAMDGNGQDKEVGVSNGRSGKSLFGKAFQNTVPTVFIDGKKKDLFENNWTFSDVDETTQIIWIDDMRKNADIEALFNMITGNMTAEKKGKDKVTFSFDNSKKFYVTSNHSPFQGEGSSYTDRVHSIVFSDYYNETHRPVHDFEKLFFTQWDPDQWNRYFNLIAVCIHTYLKYGLVAAPQELVEAKILRQRIGEQLLDWADDYFDDTNTAAAALSSHLNKTMPKSEIYLDYSTHCKQEARFVNERLFKKKLKAYCDFKHFKFNPGHPKEGSDWGGDDKRGGIEYITIANDKYVKE